VTAGALLEARGVHKRFGGVHAVRGVDLAVQAGEVHALVGENGAGKSTLVKILSGALPPDAGVLAWEGAVVPLESPTAARRLGIQTIHQELELALPLTVAENIFLGAWPARRGFVRHAELARRSAEVLGLLGADLAPAALVRDLGVADRQVVEIARAIAQEARVLIMDEPTAALPPREIERLHERIAALRAAGVGIVYVSHRLDEVLRVADRVSVMRDGSLVARLRARETDRATLIAHILGRELGTLDLTRAAPAGSDEAIRCRGLQAAPDLHEATFAVARGEIVGVFGLLGSGQSAVAQALFGLRPAQAATCRLGTLARLPSSPREAVAHRVGYVPADRKLEGLLAALSVRENLLLPALGRVTRWGFVNGRLARSLARTVAERYRVRCAGVEQRAGELSGGNQQKVVLGKWASSDARILLLDQPTRGVDVGAKAEIYRLLRARADEGGTCLIVSSDPEEIATIADRAYVLRRGRIAAELAAGALHETALTAAAL
jgi:ABC-type sugar transport system ATPase subunit